MITLHQATSAIGQKMICAEINDGRHSLPASLTKWDDDELRCYSRDDVEPSPIKDAIIAERVLRQKDYFKIEQGFTDDDIGTDHFEVLFRIWVEDQL